MLSFLLILKKSKRNKNKEKDPEIKREELLKKANKIGKYAAISAGTIVGGYPLSKKTNKNKKVKINKDGTVEVLKPERQKIVLKN